MPNRIQASNDIEIELKQMKFDSTPDIREKFLNGMGIAWEIYREFLAVTATRNCLILIRTTNPGVVYGFTKGRNVTGKTLLTKLKSSEYPPIHSNLGFFTFLSKKAVEDSFSGTYAKDKYWQKLRTEQNQLLGVVQGHDAEMHTVQGRQVPDQNFIPKLLPWTRLQEIANIKVPPASPPAWVVQLVKPTKTGQDPLIYQAAVWWPENLSAKRDAREGEIPFLWVNAGPFADANKAFAAEMNQDAQPALPFSLAVDQAAPQDAYFRLYAQPPKEAEPDDQQKRFARKLEKIPEGAPAGDWLAVSILAQFKIDKGDDPANPKAIFYYEIVADYDVFSISPPIDEVVAKVRAAGASTREPLDSYFPKFSAIRGLISEYERDVRVSMNQAMKGNNWLNTIADGITETVLHGCEVNNYFYPQPFGDLILVAPGVIDLPSPRSGAPDPTACPRFRFSSQAYLDLLSGKIDLPAIELNGQTWPAWKANSAMARHWLVNQNLMWDGSVERLGALLESAREEPLDMQTVRLWYFGGMYRYTFLEQGKAFDTLAGHLRVDDHDGREKYKSDLLRMRTLLKAAIDVIVNYANRLRATAAGQGSYAQSFALALHQVDAGRVSSSDAETSLKKYLGKKEELWETWLRMPRAVKLTEAVTEEAAEAMKTSPLPPPPMVMAKILQGLHEHAELSSLTQDDQELGLTKAARRRLERIAIILRLWQLEMARVLEATASKQGDYGHDRLTADLTRNAMIPHRPASAPGVPARPASDRPASAFARTRR